MREQTPIRAKEATGQGEKIFPAFVICDEDHVTSILLTAQEDAEKKRGANTGYGCGFGMPGGLKCSLPTRYA